MTLKLELRKAPAESQAPKLEPPDPRADSGAAVADYIAEVSAELSIMAYRNGLPMLAYILDMARLEAESLVDRADA